MSENNNDKIWEENRVTAQARKLVIGLDRFPVQSKITIIMRHSQRFEPKLVNESDLEGANMELTPLGEKLAKLFGESLPKNRKVRLFHSPRSRCEVTASEIYRGITEVNGSGHLIGECSALYGIGINGQSYLDEFNSQKSYQVILKYLAGIYSPELWPPAEPFYKKSGETIWNQTETISQGDINIFVTHDFHIMIFRFGWFGLPPDKRWVNYLGGFAFSIMEDHILLLDYGKLIKVSIPFWWKKGEL